MKEHHQLCGVALASDAVMDRWSPLILRELLTGPKRFSELKATLGPVASNLLSSRLASLSEAGLVNHCAGPLSDAPVPRGGVYRLTALGASFRPVLYALIRWSRGLFTDLDWSEPWETAPHWLLLAVPALLSARPSLMPDFDFGLQVGGLRMGFSCRKDHLVDSVVAAVPLVPVLEADYASALAFFAGALPLRPRHENINWNGNEEAYEILAGIIAVQSSAE